LERRFPQKKKKKEKKIGKETKKNVNPNPNQTSRADGNAQCTHAQSAALLVTPG
jgi:hypothetical protein